MNNLIATQKQTQAAYLAADPKNKPAFAAAANAYHDAKAALVAAYGLRVAA
jgi:hypothetical protein